jgi:hypothetical protein
MDTFILSLLGLRNKLCQLQWFCVYSNENVDNINVVEDIIT